MERSIALQKLRALDLALVDTGLYLNAYPCPKALAYFRETAKEREAFAKTFEASFGPLRMENGADETCWSWTKYPLPWESEAN